MKNSSTIDAILGLVMLGMAYKIGKKVGVNESSKKLMDQVLAIKNQTGGEA